MAIKTTVIAFVDESGGTPVSVDVGAKNMMDSIEEETVDVLQINDMIEPESEFADERRTLIDTQVREETITSANPSTTTAGASSTDGDASEKKDTSQGRITSSSDKDEFTKVDTSSGADTSEGVDTTDSNGDEITDQETTLVTTTYTYLIETIIVDPNTGGYDVIGTRTEKEEVTQVVLGSDSRYKATSQKRDSETGTGDY